jgi:hypothetical protein
MFSTLLPRNQGAAIIIGDIIDINIGVIISPPPSQISKKWYNHKNQ